MDTPFFDAIAALAARGPRFYVPGSKGNPAASGPFGPLLHYDLTEIEGADDLSGPSGPLARSEANMARAYGSGATLYSASGSTSCIQAMLALFVGAGGALVAARGCHVAAVRAMALLDLEPRWVPLRAGRPCPADVDAALAESGAGAVYVTSPDYYGRMADIAALSAVCRRHGAVLLVDNAHGAYLRFLPQSRHPLSLGADACADSAHKTLPCLTPAAMLHLRDGVLAPHAREMLNLFSSTSPSYLVLQSLDLAAGMLLEALPDFEAVAQRLKQVAAVWPVLCPPCDDALRLCLHPAAADIAYAAVMAELDKAGIVPEYADGECIILMASPWNKEEDFAILEQVIRNILQIKTDNNAQNTQGNSPETAHGAAAELAKTAALPAAAMRIRAAFFAPRERLPVAQAAGRVLAGLHAPCPPGVPLVLPGEVLDASAVAALKHGGILSVDVVK